ncbi:hypothetical protein [Pseudomonas sp. AK106]|jgi:hypothetical protein|nr:hypothetical protein AO263_32295 [Pseudomonas sp. NZIPFR-PS5]
MKCITFGNLLIGAALATSLAGCGSIAQSTQSDSDLREKAAFALNTSADKLSILSKSSSLDSMRFQVKSNKGIYNCYFTSVVVVNSDAICSGPINSNQAAQTPDEAAPAQNCNALLKAAKRC